MLNLLKLRYSIIFHYGSKKIGYILLKTFCILIFFAPFFIYGVYNFILGLLLLIPSYLPIVCIPARIICFISDSILSIFYMLLTLADIIFESENMKVIEMLNNQGCLR